LRLRENPLYPLATPALNQKEKGSRKGAKKKESREGIRDRRMKVALASFVLSDRPGA
jgi:hypothetical protein